MQTVLTEERRTEGSPLHARPCDSSFHVHYSDLSTRFMCSSSKHTGWDTPHKQNTRKEGAVELLACSWRTRKKAGCTVHPSRTLCSFAPKLNSLPTAPPQCQLLSRLARPCTSLPFLRYSSNSALFTKLLRVTLSAQGCSLLPGSLRALAAPSLGPILLLALPPLTPASASPRA